MGCGVKISTNSFAGLGWKIHNADDGLEDGCIVDVNTEDPLQPDLFIDVENIDAWDSDAVPSPMELQMYFPAILRGTNICR